jgi:hypothetical protein
MRGARRLARTLLDNSRGNDAAFSCEEIPSCLPPVPQEAEAPEVRRARERSARARAALEALQATRKETLHSPEDTVAPGDTKETMVAKEIIKSSAPKAAQSSSSFEKSSDMSVTATPCRSHQAAKASAGSPDPGVASESVTEPTPPLPPKGIRGKRPQAGLSQSLATNESPSKRRCAAAELTESLSAEIVGTSKQSKESSLPSKRRQAGHPIIAEVPELASASPLASVPSTAPKNFKRKRHQIGDKKNPPEVQPTIEGANSVESSELAERKCRQQSEKAARTVDVAVPAPVEASKVRGSKRKAETNLSSTTEPLSQTQAVAKPPNGKRRTQQALAKVQVEELSVQQRPGKHDQSSSNKDAAKQSQRAPLQAKASPPHEAPPSQESGRRKSKRAPRVKPRVDDDDSE